MSGTMIPPRRRAVKNESTTATTATARRPYWISVEAQLAGARARTWLMVAPGCAHDLHIKEHDDRDGTRHCRQCEHPVRYVSGSPQLVSAWPSVD